MSHPLATPDTLIFTLAIKTEITDESSPAWRSLFDRLDQICGPHGGNLISFHPGHIFYNFITVEDAVGAARDIAKALDVDDLGKLQIGVEYHL